MLKTLQSGSDSEIQAALDDADALNLEETAELIALWKTHRGSAIKKKAKALLQKSVPEAYATFTGAFKASVGTEDVNFSRKLLALKDQSPTLNVDALALAFLRRTPGDQLGLGYLCAQGGPAALAGLRAAVNKDGRLTLAEVPTVPSAIAELRELRELRLYDVPMESLPQSLTALESLTKLDLNHNGLEDLGPLIGQLKSLRELRLTEPIRGGLGELYALEELRTLEIYDSKLPAFDERLGQMQGLQRLVLTRHVPQLPDSLGALSALRHLEINEVQMDLPAQVFSLASLEVLSAPQARLDLDARLSGLTKLVRLQLRSDTIPAELGALENLETLSLRGDFAALPEEASKLTALKTLDLRDCSNLSELPRGLLRLEHIEAIDIRGTKVPASFHKRARGKWPYADVRFE